MCHVVVVYVCVLHVHAMSPHFMLCFQRRCFQGNLSTLHAYVMVHAYVCRYIGGGELGIIISWLVIFKVALDMALACCYLWGDGQMDAGSDQGSAAKGSAKDLEAPVSLVRLAVVYPLPPLSFPCAVL